MSHEATNWAIKQRGLKPTTKIVLWHLCDRFNARRWAAKWTVVSTRWAVTPMPTPK
jgi:hypothetical protein